MDYDLIIIGAGPGGYVAAERAGEQGKKVLLIEKAHLGGVCLNCGCVPSKTLLNSAKVYHYASHGGAYGVTASEVKFDLATAMGRKREVIETLRKGIAGLMKMNKVEVVKGEARLVSSREVQVGEQRYRGANILIATGSSPARPPIPGIDNACVYDSTRLLELDTLPERLIVVGGGVIGCEFACFFGTLGIPVTVIEMLPEICPAVDAEVAKLLRQELGKRNITFHLGARVLSIGEGSVTFAAGGKEEICSASHVLVAMRYDAIPGVIYTTPEVATVGLTEAAAKERGIPVKTAKRPMAASGRFLAENADGRGICKVVVHAETGVLLGVHMIGGACSEMIYGAVAMIETEMRVKEIEDLVFPHPTVSELIRETALMIH